MEASRPVVVGLGASAGGVEAISRFFRGVPTDSGLAFVVVLHLSPEHESHLAEVLQLSTALPVEQVRSRVPVEPNRVYVIPPRQSLTMQDGDLVLSEVASFEERRAPVDIFFRTLAVSHGSRAVAVVLSGTGANGSMGLKRVKEMGGICFVQDPDEAEYSDMPRNSIATGMVDRVLPAAEIPLRIIAYAQTIDQLQLPRRWPQEGVPAERALREILAQLRSRTGHDFSGYKRPTILRRIARRMTLHHLTELDAYCAFLREHPDELTPLLKDLLISVTNFFRDREAFDALGRTIPSLFAGRDGNTPVRVWIPGCATGEEAYSVAMLLVEHASASAGAGSFQIFATDIDADALAVAREGVYTANDAADVSPDRLSRFFSKEGSRYRVRPVLREQMLFASHNVLKDPPFSHLDLVSCRNLLIYLNRSAQQRLIEVMHFALNPGGYLFLGSSESIEGPSDLFITVDKDARLFQSRAVAARLTVPQMNPSERDEPKDQWAHGRGQLRERLSATGLHHRLLEQYAPPSVVVNEEHEIIRLSEHAGSYLRYGGGEPSHNLLKAIRPELRIELRSALHQAAEQRTNVEMTGVAFRHNERAVTLDIIVRPVLQDNDPARGFFLVLFRERGDIDVPPAAEPSATLSADDAVRQLEEEMLALKSQLRATIERHEAQADDLKASNEELQAMNEELRSSAEELETSKEELQSLNEELRTVNQELKVKVEEQSHANDDIQNLIIATEIGIVFLDRAQRIKLFTPPARGLFTLIPADHGRPLSDISSSLIEVDLNGIIERVLNRLERVEQEVRTRAGRHHLMRVLPYRTADNRIDGVVITFVDITAIKSTEAELHLSERRYGLLVDSIADHAVFTTDAQGHIDTWNPGAAKIFGYTEREAIGRSADILRAPDDRAAAASDRAVDLSRSGRHADEGWHLRKDGTMFLASAAVSPLTNEAGDVIGFVHVARDLAERRRHEDELARVHAETEARVHERTEYLTMANEALDAELRDQRQVEEQIRGLIRRLITVQEDERRRIARDLHDHLGQQVAGLGLKLDALARQSEMPLREVIEDLRTTVGQLDRDLDFFTWELRPAALDDLGLVVTLKNFVDEWSKEFSIPAEFHARGLDDLRLPYEIETNLYRIGQEALNNVYKHARASRVGVMLERRDDRVVLVIEDDGTGFDRADVAGRAARGIGLLGMEERAALIGGTVEFETSPGHGTTVFVRVPLR
jgi:two-component system CheB/CheR fusion protein